ncbi:MAG: hypothetical protein AB1446_09935 [Bacillota bacterium]
MVEIAPPIIADFDNPPDDEELLDVPPFDDEEVMIVIRAANRRFEPPPWMIDWVRLKCSGKRSCLTDQAKRAGERRELGKLG